MFWGRASLSLLAVAGLFMAGCSDETPAPVSSALACSIAWEALTSPAQEADVPVSYKDGQLYYWSILHESLMTLPAAGGEASQVMPGIGRDLTVEGNHFLFSGGAKGLQFFEAPVAGGAPHLVLDGAAGQQAPSLSLWRGFTGSEVFWTQEDEVGTSSSVWHASRDGGTATLLGKLPAGDSAAHPSILYWYPRVGLAKDAVLFANDGGLGLAQPFSGGPPRTLALPDADPERIQAVGVDGNGVYWQVPRGREGAARTQSRIVLSPADGSPAQVFWDEVPANGWVDLIWPDGEGGWLMVGRQKLDDDLRHTVIFAYDGKNAARRLACSPGDSSTSWADQRIAVAKDAVYLGTTDLRENTWQIVRVPR